MRTGIKVLIIVAAIVMTLMTVVGCSFFDPLAAYQASKDLEAKYGEPFRVYKVGGTGTNSIPSSGHNMVCAPKKDPSMKFYVLTNSGGHVSMDEYAQTMIGKQISELITPAVEQIASDFAVSTYAHGFEYTDYDDLKSETTLNSFIENSPPRRAHVDIVVNAAALKGLSYEDEYKTFSSFIQNELPGAVYLFLYTVDSKQLKESKTFFYKNTDKGQGFIMMMYKKPSVRIWADAGIVQTTLEQYVSDRESGLDTTTPSIYRDLDDPLRNP